MSQLHEYNRYKYIIENIKDVIWEMNTDFVFTFVSPNIKEMTGYMPEDLVGRKMPDFLMEESRNYVLDQAIQRRKERISGNTEELILYEVKFICKDGLEKWVEASSKLMFEGDRFVGYIGTTRDITEKKNYESQLEKYIQELKTMNAQLEKTARIDTLTGAYNRRKFDEDLTSIIMKNEESDQLFSLIFFDIDRFKTVNDRFGHKIGDFVLQCITKLVIDNIRNIDGLFRWGGEEFIVILPNVNLVSAEKIAEKIRNIIQSHDFGIGQKISISLGVGEYQPNEDFDKIMQRVDNALLKAKSDGRNRVVSC